MLILVFSGFMAAFIAPWIHRSIPRFSGWFLAGVPLALFCLFAVNNGPVAGGEIIRASLPWAPSLGVTLSLYLDGLSLLFSLLILGTGTLVLIYSSGYLKGHHHLGRFYSFILLFMSSMLGLVLADNILTLFVFWELTSLSSYLLIGFEHGRSAARKGALQALLVTGTGGLALLAGLLLMGMVGGSMELSELLNQGELIRSHQLYLPILLLILAGAFTKSAQFPFHFWLPSAMEAPAPVSAYLHSATMVKAGIYLLARLSPIVGGTDAWFALLVSAGGVTMLAGAILSVLQKDLKLILAYATVSSLGMLTLLLGLHTELGVQAAMVFLLVHALYKGTLFLVAGIVDHSTGTRNVDLLGGLYKGMPVIAAAAVMAALSMGGLPPLFGFVGKELLYEAQLQSPQLPLIIIGAGVTANILIVAAAAMLVIKPFFGPLQHKEQEGHPPGLSLWLGPLLLAVLGLFFGIAPGAVARLIISPAVNAVRGEPVMTELALWHGVNPVFLLGVATVLCGTLVYMGRTLLHRGAIRWKMVGDWGPARWYDLSLEGMLRTADFQTRFLQSGYLRYYLMTVLAAAFMLLIYTLAGKAGITGVTAWPSAYFHEWVIAIMILMAAVVAATSDSRLATVAALGVVGYGVALIYILFGAPDLAMTQFSIETLSIILFVLVLYRLPRFSILSGKVARTRDILVALANGSVMTLLVLTATSEPVHSRISRFFAENALVQAHGHNVVNVILVDFRALDTLGEITVLAVASLGVYALLKGRSTGEKK